MFKSYDAGVTVSINNATQTNRDSRHVGSDPR